MSFTENNKDGIIYMSSSKLNFQHAFLTRYGGISTGEFSSLNLGSNRGDDREHVRENYRRVCALFGSDENSAVVTHQVHGTEVRIVTEADKHLCLSDVPYEADGIVTNVKGLPLFCFVADCVPLLIEDPVAGVVGAIHCGWKSSVNDIISVTIDKMKSLGSNIENIHAAMGASIGKCCFECDDDVPNAVSKYLFGDDKGLFVKREDGKTLVDLRGANKKRLVQLGVKEENIDVSTECTYCLHDKYWSHRYTKGHRGNLGAVIMI